MGNASYKAGEFRKALACYTAGIRVPDTGPAPGPMASVRKALWMNRSRAYAALGLWMLAYVDVWLLEAGMGVKFTDAKDLWTLVNYQTELGELQEARRTCQRLAKLVPLPDPDNQQRLQQQLTRIQKLEDKQRQQQAAQAGMSLKNVSDRMTAEQKARFASQSIQGLYSPCALRLFEHEGKEEEEEDEEARSAYLKIIDKILMPHLETRTTQDSGTGVVARDDCAMGATIMIDKPLITGSVADDRCASCSKLLLVLVTVGCKRECGELYCSTVCRDDAANTYHTWQCDKGIQSRAGEMRREVNAQGATMSSRVPLCISRALGLVARNRNLLERVPLLQHLSLGKFAQGQVSVQQGLQQYAQILQDLRLDPAWFDYFTYDYARFALINNAFGMSGSNQDSSSLGFGMAIYAGATYFNHSCVPDVEWSLSDTDTNGSVMRLVALRDCKAGEELRISYIDLVTKKTLEKRTEALLQYGFTCNCARCTAERV